MKFSAPWVAGGMGEVYGARDSVLKREVAISLAAAGARESTSGSTPFRRDPGNLSRREACLACIIHEAVRSSRVAMKSRWQSGSWVDWAKGLKGSGLLEV